MAQDIRGVEINVGDTVVFGLAQTKTLSIGKVIKINPKTVKIEYKALSWHWKSGECKEYTEECLREFDNVVVTNGGFV